MFPEALKEILLIGDSPSFFYLAEDPAQIGKGISLITVLDINDNAPGFAIDYETLLCENAMPGQVRPRQRLCSWSSFPSFFPAHSLEV